MIEIINSIILFCTIHVQSDVINNVPQTRKECVKELIICVQKEPSYSQTVGFEKCLTR
jgi:hypothetical protein